MGTKYHRIARRALFYIFNRKHASASKVLYHNRVMYNFTKGHRGNFFFGIAFGNAHRAFYAETEPRGFCNLYLHFAS